MTDDIQTNQEAEKMEKPISKNRIAWLLLAAFLAVISLLSVCGFLYIVIVNNETTIAQFRTQMDSRSTLFTHKGSLKYISHTKLRKYSLILDFLEDYHAFPSYSNELNGHAFRIIFDGNDVSPWLISKKTGAYITKADLFLFSNEELIRTIKKKYEDLIQQLTDDSYVIDDFFEELKLFQRTIENNFSDISELSLEFQGKPIVSIEDFGQLEDIANQALAKTSYQDAISQQNKRNVFSLINKSKDYWRKAKKDLNSFEVNYRGETYTYTDAPLILQNGYKAQAIAHLYRAVSNMKENKFYFELKMAKSFAHLTNQSLESIIQKNDETFSVLDDLHKYAQTHRAEITTLAAESTTVKERIRFLAMINKL